MTDYTTKPGPAMLDALGTDGHKWAKAFMQHAEKHGPNYVCEDTMIGWFCNAIMHTHDTITGNGPVVLPDGSAVCIDTI